MNIETLDARCYSESDALAIQRVRGLAWPDHTIDLEEDLRDMLQRWRNYDGPEAQHPRAFVVREQDRVIAHATFEPRTIGSSVGEMTVLGLARVCTDPAVRGKGLGRAVVSAAFELVRDGTFPFSLFQTSNQVRPFYEKLGAMIVENPIIDSTCDEPTECPFSDEVVMRYPAGAGWPTGEIDLRGPGY